MSKSELKPCPFCGGEVTLEPSKNAPETLFVFTCPPDSSCRNSGLGCYAIEGQLSDAITAWNTRAAHVVKPEAWVIRLRYPDGRLSGPMLSDVLPKDETQFEIVKPLYSTLEAKPAPVVDDQMVARELHGPYGYLNGRRDLMEDDWCLDWEPIEVDQEHFSIRLYALTDPFKEHAELEPEELNHEA